VKARIGVTTLTQHELSHVRVAVAEVEGELRAAHLLLFHLHKSHVITLVNTRSRGKFTHQVVEGGGHFVDGQRGEGEAQDAVELAELVSSAKPRRVCHLREDLSKQAHVTKVTEASTIPDPWQQAHRQ